MAKWQPIDTYDKKEAKSVMLAYFEAGETEPDYITTGYYASRVGEEYFWFSYGLHLDGNQVDGFITNDYLPTHWMDIPCLKPNT